MIFFLHACISVHIKMLPREEDVSWHLKSCLRKLFPQQGTAEKPRVPKAQVSGLTEHDTYRLAKGLNPKGGSQITTSALLIKCSLLITPQQSEELSSLDTAVPPNRSRLQNLPKIQALNSNRRMQGWLTQGCCYFRLLAEDRSIKSWIYP